MGPPPTAAKSGGPAPSAPVANPPASGQTSVAPASMPPAAQPAARSASSAPAQTDTPIDLTQHDNQTIDFSGGKAVVKETPEDKAALDAGLKEIADATKDVTFGPPKKPTPPPPAPAKP